MHEVSFPDDTFAWHDLHDSGAAVEGRPEWEGYPVSNAADEYSLKRVGSGFANGTPSKQPAVIGGSALPQPEQIHLGEINLKFDANCRDLEDSGNPQKCRPVSLAPSHERDYTAVNHTQPKTYLPFPNWRRVSQTPSSPSVYPATLSVVEDDDSVYQASLPTSISYLKDVPVQNQSYKPSANIKRRSSHRVPVKLGVYTNPLESRVDQGTADALQQEPLLDGDQSISPRTPSKSPLRTTIPLQAMYPKGP